MTLSQYITEYLGFKNNKRELSSEEYAMLYTIYYEQSAKDELVTALTDLKTAIEATDWL